jgi:hypothetical protein
MMFIVQTKKKREVKSGTKRSPSLPIISLAMLSRINKYPTSTTFCSPVGTNFGFPNAIKNTTETITVQMIDKITGFVMSIEVSPNKLMEASGGHSKIPAPGAGKGQVSSPNLQLTSTKEIKLATSTTSDWLHFTYYLSIA